MYYSLLISVLAPPTPNNINLFTCVVLFSGVHLANSMNLFIYVVLFSGVDISKGKSKSSVKKKPAGKKTYKYANQLFVQGPKVNMCG